MKNNKGIDKVIKGYEKEFKGHKGLKKNLNTEIDIRHKRHREEMLNLDRNLEGKSTEEAMKILDGMEERTQGLIGCIDNRIDELNGELDNLEKESEKIDRDTDRAMKWGFGIGGAILIGLMIIAVVVGWIR